MEKKKRKVSKDFCGKKGRSGRKGYGYEVAKNLVIERAWNELLKMIDDPKSTKKDIKDICLTIAPKTIQKDVKIQGNLTMSKVLEELSNGHQGISTKEELED